MRCIKDAPGAITFTDTVAPNCQQESSSRDFPQQSVCTMGTRTNKNIKLKPRDGICFLILSFSWVQTSSTQAGRAGSGRRDSLLMVIVWACSWGFPTANPGLLRDVGQISLVLGAFLLLYTRFPSHMNQLRIPSTAFNCYQITASAKCTLLP